MQEDDHDSLFLNMRKKKRKADRKTAWLAGGGGGGNGHDAWEGRWSGAGPARSSMLAENRREIAVNFRVIFMI